MACWRRRSGNFVYKQSNTLTVKPERELGRAFGFAQQAPTAILTRPPAVVIGPPN